MDSFLETYDDPEDLITKHKPNIKGGGLRVNVKVEPGSTLG